MIVAELSPSKANPHRQRLPTYLSRRRAVLFCVAVRRRCDALLSRRRGSTLMDLTGIGPSGAARLLADVGDIHRFADLDKFAS
jgi:transposase